MPPQDPNMYYGGGYSSYNYQQQPPAYQQQPPTYQQQLSTYQQQPQPVNTFSLMR